MKSKRKFLIAIIVILQVVCIFKAVYVSKFFLYDFGYTFKSVMNFVLIFSFVLVPLQFFVVKKQKLLILFCSLTAIALVGEYEYVYKYSNNDIVAFIVNIVLSKVYLIILPLTYIAMYFALKLPHKPSRIEQLEEEVARLKGEK